MHIRVQTPRPDIRDLLLSGTREVLFLGTKVGELGMAVFEGESEGKIAICVRAHLECCNPACPNEGLAVIQLEVVGPVAVSIGASCEHCGDEMAHVGESISPASEQISEHRDDLEGADREETRTWT